MSQDHYAPSASLVRPAWGGGRKGREQEPAVLPALSCGSQPVRGLPQAQCLSAPRQLGAGSWQRNKGRQGRGLLDLPPAGLLQGMPYRGGDAAPQALAGDAPPVSEESARIRLPELPCKTAVRVLPLRPWSSQPVSDLQIRALQGAGGGRPRCGEADARRAGWEAAPMRRIGFLGLLLAGLTL